MVLADFKFLFFEQKIFNGLNFGCTITRTTEILPINVLVFAHRNYLSDMIYADFDNFISKSYTFILAICYIP